MRNMGLGDFLCSDDFTNYRRLNDVFLQVVLEAHTNQSIEDGDLRRDSFGKRFLNPEKFAELHFNKSNTKEHLVMAVAPFAVGIDLEMVQESFRSEILTQVVHPNDSIKVHHAADFYALWSMKEAFVKYLGKGLQIPMKEVCVSEVDANHFTATHATETAEIQAITLFNDQKAYLAHSTEVELEIEFMNSAYCEELVLAKLTKN